MCRNPVELGGDALKGPGEVHRVRRSKRGSTPVEKLFQFLITPPRLRDVMIRKETSIACYEKSCAKDVNLQRRPGPPCFERYHPLVVHLRLTRGICRHTNQLSGVFVPKLHDHMQQADARSVCVNNCFRDSPLILKPAQASLSLLKLLLEGFAIAVRGYLPSDLFGLRFQRLASSRCVARGQGRARLFCAAQEIVLLQNSTAQACNLRLELQRNLPAAPVRNDHR